MPRPQAVCPAPRPSAPPPAICPAPSPAAARVPNKALLTAAVDTQAPNPCPDQTLLGLRVPRAGPSKQWRSMDARETGWGEQCWRPRRLGADGGAGPAPCTRGADEVAEARTRPGPPCPRALAPFSGPGSARGLVGPGSDPLRAGPPHLGHPQASLRSGNSPGPGRGQQGGVGPPCRDPRACIPGRTSGPRPLPSPGDPGSLQPLGAAQGSQSVGQGAGTVQWLLPSSAAPLPPAPGPRPGLLPRALWGQVPGRGALVPGHQA